MNQTITAFSISADGNIVRRNRVTKREGRYEISAGSSIKQTPGAVTHRFFIHSGIPDNEKYRIETVSAD